MVIDEAETVSVPPVAVSSTVPPSTVAALIATIGACTVSVPVKSTCSVPLWIETRSGEVIVAAVAPWIVAPPVETVPVVAVISACPAELVTLEPPIWIAYAVSDASPRTAVRVEPLAPARTLRTPAVETVRPLAAVTVAPVMVIDAFGAVSETVLDVLVTVELARLSAPPPVALMTTSAPVTEDGTAVRPSAASPAPKLSGPAVVMCASPDALTVEPVIVIEAPVSETVEPVDVAEALRPEP